MKKLVYVFVLLAVGFAYGQTTVGLDDGIQNGARAVESRLVEGDKVVVLNFNSPKDTFSNYVLEELTSALVNGGKVIVVDRKNLDLIQQEMNFQLSGEVSDDSAQEIGRKLGAQSIISGSLEDMGDFYRVRFKTIEVVSAAIQVSSSLNVEKDALTARLLGVAAPRNARKTVAKPKAAPSGELTVGRRVGSGVLNLAGGLGSFTMGDWGGGLTVLAGYAAAAGLIGWELSLNYKDNPELIGTPATLALGVASITVLYGFIRPFAYQRQPSGRVATILDAVTVALGPDAAGAQALNVSYTLRF
jgi:TolB-like protein